MPSLRGECVRPTREKRLGSTNTALRVFRVLRDSDNTRGSETEPIVIVAQTDSLALKHTNYSKL
ncbi:hypothetical protein C6501_07275 [Candidatus Poribacteria bacterium]|nr:MAG: hypothetical protein C6501_07275 [Candidatus Poribacteria bacterium]